MNLELLSRAIERILSSKYDVEVSVDVRSKSKEDESAEPFEEAEEEELDEEPLLDDLEFPLDIEEDSEVE